MTPVFYGYVAARTELLPPAFAKQSTARELVRHPNVILGGTPNSVAVAQSDDSGIIVLLAGHHCRWRGDTTSVGAIATAILNAYRDNGIRCLDSLANGFAIAVIDRNQSECHIAIDRIGRVPLAYAVLANGDLCFANDARTIAGLVAAEPKLNAQALYDYTFFHAIPSSETVFDGVSKLKPATRVHWRAGKVETHTYWLPTFALRTERSATQLGEEFLQLLERGVAHCSPTSTTASFLSGGIDSSTVTGFLNKLQGGGRPAYTIGFAQAGYDETEYAKIAARHFGADLRVHYISTDQVQECIPDLAALYDEPFGNSSAVPGLVCARIAKQDGIEQLLAGDGGDELFAGNTRYAKQRIFEVYTQLPGFMRGMLDAMFLGAANPINRTPLRKVTSYINQARIPLPDRMESYNYLLRETDVQIFETEFLRSIDTQHPFAMLRERYSEPQNAPTLDRLLYLDWKFTLADNDLRKVNATCSYAGVDVAFPWLDDEVIEFCTRVPADMKMRGTKLRHFVKHALGDFLPRETITKSKHGFGLPFGQWLKTSQSLQNQVYELLSALGKRGIYREEFIRHLIAEHQGGHASYYGTMVWVLAMLEAWLQANVKTA